MKTLPMKKRARRGFSLPEVMTASSIMVMAFTVFGAAFPACGQTQSRGRHLDIASNACQQRLDFFRQVGYSSLPAITEGESSVQESFTPPSHLPGAAGVIRFTRITESFAVTTENTARVRAEATITWSGAGSDRGTVTVTSIIAQDPQ
jgi:prepilin-type N-terminal cleavage/methylation domain-containing protein